MHRRSGPVSGIRCLVVLLATLHFSYLTPVCFAGDGGAVPEATGETDVDDVQDILDEDLDEQVQPSDLEPDSANDTVLSSGVVETAKGGKKHKPKKSLAFVGHVDWDASFAEEVEPQLMVTTPTRHDDAPFYSSSAADLVEGGALAEGQVAGMDGALLDLPGVSIIQVSSAAASPVLRGIYGQRIALSFDGIPLYHSTVMPGPSLLAAMVDPLGLAGIEVIRGPGQTTSGPFAVGGVINFVPDLPVVNSLVSFRSDASALFRYGSVDTSRIVHADVDFQLRESAAALNLTIGNFGSLINGAGKQPLTSYDSISFSFAIRRSLGQAGDLIFYYGMRRMSEFFQPIDRTSEYLRWPHMGTDIIFVRYSARDLGWLSDLRVTAGLNLFDEQPQYYTDTTDPLDEDAPSLWDRQKLDTSSLFIQVWGRGPLGEWGDLLWGIDYGFDHVDASGYLKLLRGAHAWPEVLDRPMIPDGAVAHRLEPHALLEVYALRPFLLSIGTRFYLHELVPGSGLADRHIAGGSVQISGRYPLSDLAAFLVNLSFGTRPPTMFEIAGRSCGPTPMVQSPGLDPEKAFTAEAGTRWNLGFLEGSLFYSFTLFDDFIYPASAIESPVDHCSKVDPYQLFNMGTAFMHALELRNHVNIGQAWRIGTVLSWQHGTVKIDQGEGSYRVWPMSFVPPLMGTAFITVRYPRQYLWADLRLRVSLVQDRHPQTEPLFGAEDDPFFLLSFKGGLDLGDHLRLYVAFENLLNQVHRYLGSSIDGPGRSVYVGLEGHL